MARSALSKLTTYSTLTTNVRNEARITTSGFSLMTDAYIRSLILLAVQRWAKVLTDAEKPFYREKSNLTLLGIESPYYADTSALSPYWNKNVRLTHVTTGGTRTPINILDPQDTESIAKLSNVQATSINAIFLGWGFRVFFGSSVTVTTSTDVLEFVYDSQAISSNATGDYLDVPDSIVPYVKDEVLDYLYKYKGIELPSGVTWNDLRQQRYKKALENA